MTDIVQKPASRLKSLVLPLALLAVTALVIFFLFATRPELEPVAAQERVWNVEVLAAQPGLVKPVLTLFGEVVAGRRSELRPAVAGTMVRIGKDFHEGGVVRKGDLLVGIDPFDYEIALAEQRSMLKENEVKLTKLRRDLERAKELFQAKNVSEQFLDSAELDVLQQEAIVEQREIGVRRAKRDLTDTRLLAPFDGVVKSVNAALGKQSSGPTGEIVAELIDTSLVEVKFALSNAQYGRLLIGRDSVAGRQARVVWKVGAQPLEYSATIERVGAQVTATTGGIDVYAVIDTGGKQSQLRPGAFVTVALDDREYENAVRVPDTALQGDATIFVVVDERIVARDIEILGYAGTDIIIRSDASLAVAAGDQIVITPVRDGGPGGRVLVR